MSTVMRLAVISDVSSEESGFGITFHHVPFDVNMLASIIRASGRPYADEAIATYLHVS